jgi:hypothetical protein
MRPFLLVLVIALAGLGCDNSSPDTITEKTGESSTAYTKQGMVVAHSGGFESRLLTAIDKAPTDKLGKEALGRIKGNGGDILVDAPTKIAGLPADAKVDALLADESVKAALMANDEVAAADLLYKRGVRTVVVHHGVANSVDVGKRVLSRLYHHDYLTRFQLLRVTEASYIYRVRKKVVTFEPQLAGNIIGYVRARLAGAVPTVIPDIRSETGQWTFVATLRGQGRELAVAFSQDTNLQKSVEELIKDLERLHRRRIEYYGFPPLKDHIKDLKVELHRVTERAYIEPRSDEFLNQFWELGIDGTFMLSEDRKNRAVLPGSVAYTRSLNRPDRFLRAAAKNGKMPLKRPWRETKTHFEAFRTRHYAETAAGTGGIVELFRGFKMVALEAVTIDRVREAVVLAGEWYLANLQPDGSVVYKFWPEENRYANENNLVRHTLSTWNLVQAYEMDPRPEFLDAARKTLEFTQSKMLTETSEEHGEMLYYRYKNNVKLGAVVINILGVVDLARQTGSKEYDDLLIKLGNFTKFMAQDNGKFLGYHVPKGHPYHGTTNDIVPGEAALALVYLADYFDDDTWLEPLDKYWEYYMPLFRERAAKKKDSAPWPYYTYDNTTRLSLVQMGPWTVMAANAYHQRTGNQEIADFGLEVARWMIDTYQWSSERSPWPDYVGGYFKLREELPAMQAFCYAEGTAAAYQLAIRAAPDQIEYFETSTREAMRLGLAMQYTDLDTYPFSRPQQVKGGIRYALNETKVRIDYVHHALSSMYQYVRAAESDPRLPASVRGAAAATETPTE